MQFDDSLAIVWALLAALLTLVGVVVIGRIGRRTAELAGEPGVVGELLVGMVVANFGAYFDFPLAQKMFHWTATTEEFHHLSFSIAPIDAAALTLWLFSNIGLLLLMFYVGLENSFAQLKKVASPATRVALLGVVVPFVLGYLTSQLLMPESSTTTRLFVGGTFAATSIAVTARVLKDAGILQTFEAQVVLGAAVLDDVIGMLLLAGISAWAAGVSQFSTLIFNSVIVVAYLLGAWASARAPIFTHLARLEGWLAPVFFVVTGMQVNLKLLLNPSTLLLATIFTAVAVIGKIFSGITLKTGRYLVGVAMIPRGEIGLVFASFGHSLHLFSDEAFAALLLMVLLTSAFTPLWLTHVIARSKSRI